MRAFLPLPKRAPALSGRADERSEPAVLVLVLALLATYATLWTLLLTTARPSLPASLLAGSALPGLLTAAIGAAAALSFRYLVFGLALRAFGGRIAGIGLGLALGIPHFALDLRQWKLLPSPRRKWVAWAGMLGSALVPFSLGLWWLLSPEPWVGAAALGGHLAMLGNLSPLWRSDLSLFLAEVAGTRRFLHRSAGYLLRKLWSDVFSFGHLNRDSVAMLTLATISLGYLLLLLATLLAVAPATMQAGLSAALSQKGQGVAQVLASLVALLVWAALFASLMALMASAAGALVRLYTLTRPKPKPLSSTEVPALSMMQLLSEVTAIPPFNGLSPAVVQKTLASGRIEQFAAGSTIIWPGDPGTCCYLVRSGTCRVEVEDAAGQRHTVALRQPGDLFGETALLTDVPRTAAVVAQTATELLVIDRDAFLEAVDAAGFNRMTLTINLRLHLFLKHHPMLQGVPGKDLAALAQAVTVRRLREGELLLEEGAPGSSMYLILTGKLRVERSGMGVVGHLTPGDFVGEIAMLTGAPRTASVTALKDSDVVEIGSEVFARLVAPHFSSGLLVDEEAERRLESLMMV